MKKLKWGFTLAEILITMGIIGVVAALTIPVLVSNSNANAYKTALKKNISVLNSAINTSMARSGIDLENSSVQDYEDLANWILTGDVSGTGYPILAVIARRTAATSVPYNGSESLWLTDGTRLAFFLHRWVPTYGCLEITDPKQFNPQDQQLISGYFKGSCYVIVDVNGDKGPNTISTASNTSDVWLLGITKDAVLPVIATNDTRGLLNPNLTDINGNAIYTSEVTAGNSASYSVMTEE